MRNGSETAHGDPWPARTPSPKKQSSFFSGFVFERGRSVYLLSASVAARRTVVLGSCLPPSNTRTRDGFDIEAVLHFFFSDCPGRDGKIVDICDVVFWFD